MSKQSTELVDTVVASLSIRDRPKVDRARLTSFMEDTVEDASGDRTTLLIAGMQFVRAMLSQPNHGHRF